MFKNLKSILSIGLFLVPYFIFSQLNGTVIGDAVDQGNNCFTITPDLASQAGGAWYNNAIDFDNDFIIYYTANFGTKNGGADGMALVFKTDAIPQIGGTGGGIGYFGISNSLIVEFDTWQNSNNNDPSYDHIGIVRDGAPDHSNTATNLVTPVQAHNTNVNIEDGNNHNIKVQWVASTNTLSVYFDCILRQTLVQDVKNTIFSGDDSVFFGFVGSTGGAFNLHQVCFDSITFVDNLTLEDENICLGESVDVDATTSNGVSYSWSPTTGVSNPNIADPTLSPTITTTYTVTITDNCNDTYTSSTTISVNNGADNDNDTISDTCDLDDDNDGILDCEESYTGPVFFGNPLGTNEHFYEDSFSTYSGSVINPNNLVGGTLESSPSGNFGLGVTNNTGGSYMFTASNPIRELEIIPYTESVSGFFDVNDIITFDADVPITLENPQGHLIVFIDGVQDTSLVITTESPIIFSPIAGINAVGASDFTFTMNNVSTFTFTLQSTGGNPNGATFLMNTNCALVDTDGDGIPNHLDTDSDNDGCPDALESNGNTYHYTDLDTDNSLSGAIDTNSSSATYGVPNSQNYGIGSSQNSSIQSDICSPCNLNNPLFTDNDMDGIGDNCDLDDDNDGILDVDECTTNSITNGDFTGTLADWTTTGNWGLRFGTEAFVNNDTGGISDLSQTITVSSSSATLDYDLIANNSHIRDAHIEIYVNGTLIESYTSHEIVNNTSGGYYHKQTVLNVACNSTATILFKVIVSPGAGGANDIGVDNVFVRACDTDGDCIPNYLDLDSDNDGCPDALESNGNTYHYTDLDTDNSLSGAIDTNSSSATYGVPNSQNYGIGSSQNSSIQSDICSPCNLNNPLFTDNDMDGIGDNCDLDDDNDGILDVDECTTNSITNGDFTGTLADWTTTGNWGLRFGTEAFVNNDTGGISDLSQTITVSSSSATLDYDLIANNSHIRDAHIEIYVNGTLIESYTSHEIVNNTSGGYYHKQTVLNVACNSTATILFKVIVSPGAGGANDIGVDNVFVRACDTDGDCIPNYLDLDSDNDGCPDALESNGNTYHYTDLDTDNSLSGAIDTNSSSATYGVPNSQNYGIGSSQNSSIQSDICSPCNLNNPLFTDNDMDGIGDNCDLDDDNDGILDEHESQCDTQNTSVTNNSALSMSGSIWDFNTGTDYVALQGGDPCPVTDFISGYDSVNIGSVINLTFATPLNFNINASGELEFCFFVYSNINNVAGIYHTTDRAFNLVTNIGTLNGTVNYTVDIPVLDNGGWVRKCVTFNVPPNQPIQVLGFSTNPEIITGGTNTTFNVNNSEVIAFAIDNINSCNTPLDTDNDGIPDQLDTDSDNDGCPDAIEGAGNITASQLTTLTGGSNGGSSNNLGPDSDNEGNPKLNSTDTTGFEQATTTGVTTSDTFSVNPITANPSNEVCEGEDVTFSVTVSGDRVTVFDPAGNTTIPIPTGDYIYNWYKDSDPTTTLSTTNSLALTNVMAADAGDYTVEVTTSNNSCPSEQSIELTVNPLPTADAGTDQTINCTTTSAQLGAVAATGYTYSWTPMAGLDDAALAQPTATPTATTTYTLVITETATGCQDTDTVVITVDNDLPTADAGTNQTINCTTTSVQLGAVAATGYTYSWTPTAGLDDAALAQPTATPTATTTYTLVITETATGCQDTDTVVITVDNDLPTANAGTDQTINCTTTSVQLGAVAATGYTYSWTPMVGLDDAALAQPTATPTATTTYTLVITETATGCQDTDNVTITVDNDLPTANAGTDQTINCTTTSVQLGAVAATGYTYSWTPTAGLDDAALAQPTATPTATTTYTLVITETATGCQDTDNVTITVDNDLPTADAGTDQTINCITTSVQLGTVAATGYTYSWTPIAGLDDAALAQPTATPTATTTYTLVITETATGCQDTDNVTITVDNDLPTADAGTDQTVNCTTTSVQLGAVAATGYTYSWTPMAGLDDAALAQPTATPTATTTYTLVITETATGCQDTDTVVITVDNDLPTANAGTDQTVNCTTTSVQLGAVAATGYTYSWTPMAGLDDAALAQPTATPTATTTYTLVITETATGCQDTDNVTITVDNDLPTADAGTDQTVNCTTTSVQLGAVAATGYTYSWTPTTGLDDAALAQPTATPTATTTYTLVITETATGCQDTDTVVITVDNDLPTADAGTNQTINCTTTSVQLGAVAATGYTYSWTPTAGLDDAALAQPTATPTATTTYTLVITETATGCQDTDTVVITVDNDLPTANAGTDQTINCTTTSVQLGAVAATGYTYSWTPMVGLDDAALAQPTATPTATTTYTLVITETATGCQDTDNVTITVDNDLPTANAGTDQTINCTTTSVQLGAVAATGYTYSWTPTAGLDDAALAQPTATPTATTTYTLVITETATGCQDTDNVTITVDNDLPTADAGTDQTINCITTSVQLGTVAATGYTYSWTPIAGLDDAALAQPTATPTATTTYTLVITETATGCQDTDNVTITVDNDLPTADAGTDQTVNCTTTSVQLGAVAATGYTYSWTPMAGLDDAALAQPTATPTATTTYTLVITETATGCQDTDTVVITVDNDLPTANAGTDQTVNCTTTSVQLGAVAATGYTYSWTPMAGLDDAALAQPTATPTATTTYTLVITETATGCQDTDNVTITVDNDLPTADAGTDQTVNCTTTSVQLGAVAATGYTYSWTPTTGLDDAALAQPTATPTATTTYTLVITETATGCQDTDNVTITVDNDLPTADAGTDQTINCITTSVQLGTVAATGYTYSWTPIAGLDDAALAQPTATPTATTTYTLVITETATGCQDTDTVVITVDNDLPTANAGTDQTVNCTTTSVQLGAVAATGYTYSWTPTAGLDDAALAQPTATPTATTTYTLVITETATGCQDTDTVVITVDNDLPTITGILEACINNISQLSGSGTPATTNPWISSDTTIATIDNNGLVNAISSGTTSITYTSENGCTDTETFTVNPIVTPTFTQVADICIGDTLTPLPTTSNNGITGTWTPTLNNTATTTYTFSPDTPSQCGESTTMTITVNPIVTPTFTQVADICNGDTLTPLPTTSTNGITGTWAPTLDNTATTTYTFTPDNVRPCEQIVTMTITVNPIVTPAFTQVVGICIGDTISPLPTTSNNGVVGNWSPALNNTATTTYTFTPNKATQCGESTTMTIIVNPLPTPNLTDGIICITNEGVTPFTLDSELNSNYNFEWYINNLLIENQNNSTLEVSHGGIYSVVAIHKITNCRSSAVSAMVTEVDSNVIFDDNQTVYLTSDQESDITINLRRISSNANLTNIRYQIDDDNLQVSNTFLNVPTGRHVIRITDTYGCLSLEKEIFVITHSPYFSPNEDNINDVWNINGFETKHQSKITIFDRFGKVITQFSPADISHKGWNGKINGKLAPTNDYWFYLNFIEENGKKHEFRSHFSLLRN